MDVQSVSTMLLLGVSIADAVVVVVAPIVEDVEEIAEDEVDAAGVDSIVVEDVAVAVGRPTVEDLATSRGRR